MAKRVRYWKLLNEFLEKLDAEGVEYTCDDLEDYVGVNFPHTEWVVRNGKLVLVEKPDVQKSK